MLNRTMCLGMVLLSSSLLFTIPTNAKIPFVANNIKEEANMDRVVHKDKFGLLINPMQIQYEKDKAESDRIKAEEQKRLQELQKQKELEEQKRIEEESKKEWRIFVLTFYTSLSSENGYGYESITCTGAKLQDGMVASNYYKLGTEIHLENWGQVIVSDRGGNNFSNDYRLDVYIEREPNESDREYKKRVLNLGKKVVKGYIVK